MEEKMNKLDELEKRNPFTVPDGYFLTLNDEIMNRLPEKERIVARKVTMWKRTQPWLYMAAMFLGAFFIIQSIQNQSGAKRAKPEEEIAAINYTQLNDNYWSNVQISEEEFYEYLEEQLVSDGYYDYMYNQISFN